MLHYAKHLMLTLSFLLIVPLACGAGEHGHGHPAKDGKAPAILLVTFGTSVPSAQTAFAHIEQQVRKAYPKNEVRWAYTSEMIRKKLAKEGKVLDSPEIALAKLMDEGYKQVVMQSLHMIPGAEFHEMYKNGKLFGQMSGGFDRVMVASPLLSSNEAMEKNLAGRGWRYCAQGAQGGRGCGAHGAWHPSSQRRYLLGHDVQGSEDGRQYVCGHGRRVSIL